MLVATRRAGLSPRNLIGYVTVGVGAIPFLVIGADELDHSGRGGTTLGAVTGTAVVLLCTALVAGGAINLARWLGAEQPMTPDARERLAT